MEIWKNGYLEKGKFGNMKIGENEIWKNENLENWKIGKMKIAKNGNWKKCRMVKKETG